MGISSSSQSFEDVVKEECFNLLTEFSNSAQLNAEACYKSAEQHSRNARKLETICTVLGSVGFGGGIGTLSFHKHLPLRVKATLVGASAVLLGSYFNLILHTSDRGIKSNHSPFTLSTRYTESGAAWRELQEMCLFHSKVTVHDPYVSLKELEKITMEMIRRKRDVSRRIKPEDWAVSHILREEKSLDTHISLSQEINKSDDSVKDVNTA